MKLYHGTTTNHQQDILKNGLNNAYLTDSEGLALYYAEIESEEKGGTPILLAVSVNETSLEYDRFSIEEPVSYDDFSISDLEERRDNMWNEQAEIHPEWMKGEYIIIPKECYQLSLETVGSCRYNGLIQPNDIDLVSSNTAQ